MPSIDLGKCYPVLVVLNYAAQMIFDHLMLLFTLHKMQTSFHLPFNQLTFLTLFPSLSQIGKFWFLHQGGGHSVPVGTVASWLAISEHC